jgi:hypothetical protein
LVFVCSVLHVAMQLKKCTLLAKASHYDQHKNHERNAPDRGEHVNHCRLTVAACAATRAVHSRVGQAQCLISCKYHVSD